MAVNRIANTNTTNTTKTTKTTKTKLNHAFACMAALLCGWSAAALVAQEVPKLPSKIELQDGDTLVFLGDSITHQCLYTQYVEDYFYTRYPSARLHFHNAGVGGDRASDALIRFDRDVAEYRPKYVTVLLGMNDGRYTQYEQDIFDTYQADMKTLLDRIKDTGATAIPMTPTMFDARAARTRDKQNQRALRNEHYNGVLALYGAWLLEQAQTRGLGFVDMYSPLNSLTFQQRKLTPDFTLIPDAVHPGAAGQAVMAFAILNDMHINRSVSAITATYGNGKWTVKGANGEVSDVSGEDGALTFKFRAESLPWVLPEEAALGYELTKAGHKMSNERVRITGLEPGHYQLKIDGQAVGAYSHTQLQFKVELQSNQRTPQYQQALRVAMLNKQRNDEAVHKLRDTWSRMKRERRKLAQIKEGDPETIKLREAFAAWEKEFDALTQQHIARAQELEDQIYQANQPQWRTYAFEKIERKPNPKKPSSKKPNPKPNSKKPS